MSAARQPLSRSVSLLYKQVIKLLSAASEAFLPDSTEEADNNAEYCKPHRAAADDAHGPKKICEKGWARL